MSDQMIRKRVEALEQVDQYFNQQQQHLQMEFLKFIL